PLGKLGAISALCSAPKPSRARTWSVYAPSDAGVQFAVQSTQLSADSGGIICAIDQLWPPSVLYSTAWMPRLPANATPASWIRPSLTIEPSLGESTRAIVFTTACLSQPWASQ